MTYRLMLQLYFVASHILIFQFWRNCEKILKNRNNLLVISGNRLYYQDNFIMLGNYAQLKQEVKKGHDY